MVGEVLAHEVRHVRERDVGGQQDRQTQPRRQHGGHLHGGVPGDQARHDAPDPGRARGLQQQAGGQHAERPDERRQVEEVAGGRVGLEVVIGQPGVQQAERPRDGEHEAGAADHADDEVERRTGRAAEQCRREERRHRGHDDEHGRADQQVEPEVEREGPPPQAAVELPQRLEEEHLGEHGPELAGHVEVRGLGPPLRGLEVGAAVRRAVRRLVRHRVELPPQVQRLPRVADGPDGRRHGEHHHRRGDHDIEEHGHGILPAAHG